MLAAPDVFHGFDDDSVLQYDAHPDESQRSAVAQAVVVCPAAAIVVEEAGA
jgi:ferredoxin